MVVNFDLNKDGFINDMSVFKLTLIIDIMTKQNLVGLRLWQF
jgi:hypothetical protein